ncbi:hypothetical protein E5S67_05186 [Microcoleus sp. IPMA8]|uniref:Addiction module killer protein n=1 Tax=Microcoleus asticus IPMA8 TaxID=2563858 RepID=A0ABX2D725_9CYAN|nr:hypothetical protein [Microcoleus asticus IPMA8]
MEDQPKEIQRYVTPDGKIPFNEWLKFLRDIKAEAKIRGTLDRIKLGNLGDCRSVGEGVFELRIDWARLPRLLWANRANDCSPTLRWR